MQSLEQHVLAQEVAEVLSYCFTDVYVPPAEQPEQSAAEATNQAQPEGQPAVSGESVLLLSCLCDSMAHNARS